MTKLITYIGVLLAALVVASGAGAAQLEARCYHQAPRGELICAKKALHENNSKVRWIRNHAGLVLVSKVSLEHSLGYYLWRARIDHHLIAQAKHRLHARPSYAPQGFPPHHRLWLCIHGVEGPWNDTSPPYAGGMQMSIGWMKMVNDAGYLSQAQQEWLAERAWAENHYQVSFLVGQWFRWDGAYYCEKYA